MKTTRKFDRKIIDLVLIALLLFGTIYQSCDEINEDELEIPEEVIEVFEFNESISASNLRPGVLNLDEIKDHADFDHFSIASEPENGSLFFSDSKKKLLYFPDEDFEAGEDGFIITAINNDSQLFFQNIVRVVVETEEEEVEESDSEEEDGSSNDLEFEYTEIIMTSDSTLVIDLLDNDEWRALPEQNHAIITTKNEVETEGLLVSISSNSAVLTYFPPSGFVGEIEFSYQICWGYRNKGCDDPNNYLAIFDCDKYPEVCEYSILSKTKIIVQAP